MATESVAFDRAADYYDNTRGFPPGVEKEIGALMVRTGGLNAASRVLEIGVGTGRIALPVSEHVRAYIGIDLARPMMERLRAKRSTEPIYLVEGDATKLPFDDAQFDGVIAVHVFHLIPGWRDVLAEITRVLKPGAPLIHGWNGRLVLDKLQSVWNEATHDEDREVSGAIPNQRRGTFLVDVGWRPLAPFQKHTFMTERSPQDFLNSMEGRYFSSTWRMTDEQIARGAAAVRAYIAEHYADPAQPEQIEAVFNAQAYLPPT